MRHGPAGKAAVVVAVPRDDPALAALGACCTVGATAAGLLAAITANVPQRQAVVPIAAALVPAGDLFGHAATRPAPRKRTAATAPNTKPAAPQVRDWGPAAELAYETPPADEQGTASGPEATHTGVYEPWRPRTARIPGACEHPTPLVQSAAMAAPTRLTGGNWSPTLGDQAGMSLSWLREMGL